MIGEGIHSTNQRKHDYVATGRVVGFYTDPTICIGCKACEVACKEWNKVPDDGYRWSGNSYDNTDALGASTWRHVLFIEQDRPRGGNQIAGPMMGHHNHPSSATNNDLEAINRANPGAGDGSEDPFRWLFISDVCKHCEEAGCLEACPTGSIVRTEVGSVLVQNDVCNGCGYCVVACPFGVIDKRKEPLIDAGGAFKCTFCYDRQASGLTPACAKACPTESILFGPLDELRVHAGKRVATLHAQGYPDARNYDPQETSVKGIHAFFLLLGEPEAYGLPPKPQIPTIHLKAAWTSAFVTAAVALGGALAAFAFF
jgi:formate dehydrogenase iron-sulfur subunit